ncbi:MAG: hypothetical protein ACXWEA_04990 [Solirubrobacterales bacterium]
MAQTMARRTIYLSESIEALARANAIEGESFSATVARLIEAGVAADGMGEMPRYVGSGEHGPDDLGLNSEKYLREMAEEWRD